MRQQPTGSLFLGSLSWNAKWFVPKGLQLRVVRVNVLNEVRSNRADCPRTRWDEALAQEVAKLAKEDWAIRTAV